MKTLAWTTDLEAQYEDSSRRPGSEKPDKWMIFASETIAQSDVTFHPDVVIIIAKLGILNVSGIGCIVIGLLCQQLTASSWHEYKLITGWCSGWGESLVQLLNKNGIELGLVLPESGGNRREQQRPREKEGRKGSFLPFDGYFCIDSWNMYQWLRARDRDTCSAPEISMSSAFPVKDSWSGHWIMRRCSGRANVVSRMGITREDESLCLSCHRFSINILSPAHCDSILTYSRLRSGIVSQEESLSPPDRDINTATVRRMASSLTTSTRQTVSRIWWK